MQAAIIGCNADITTVFFKKTENVRFKPDHNSTFHLNVFWSGLLAESLVVIDFQMVETD